MDASHAYRRAIVRSIDLLGGTEILGEGDCWDLLASECIGRVAVAVGGQVDIFPVNYGLDGDGILFRTNAGRKMTGAAGGEVAFEVDRIDPTAKAGWSVVVHGEARDISAFDGPERLRAAQPWTGSKDFLLRIVPRSITGRRVVP
jgi:nitroimidazol reductase NimA-like FMN-containing flavoprotein (pyridoxamine 5'-phosphate oxidase superfamily)